MQKRHIHARFHLGAVLAVLIILTFMRHWNTAVAALFRQDDAVHIEPETIENATLIIGTHLIYLHALNQEIYAIASDSASSSGQDRRYYKSELAGGMWFDITDAGSIKDITAAGTIVDENEIRSLYITHHTKSDKITYDLRTNAKVCIFDIYNVYDLENMPELEPLKLQYDMMKESGDTTKTAKRNREFVQKFFAMQVTSTTTDVCDKQIQALQGYYDELAANGADSKASETVLKVMEKVDNCRKAAVFLLVQNGLESLEDTIADVSDKKDVTLDDALLAAIEDSKSAVSEHMGEAQGNMLAKGDTVISETEYILSDEMITNAINSNYFSCDDQNYKLQYLQNISNGQIVDRQGETNLLEEMIDKADVMYGRRLSGGASQAYLTLVSRNVSHAALQSRIKEDMADANAARGELEFFIQGKVDRLDKEDAKKYVLQRIQDAAKFKSVIKTDDYTAEYQNSISSYVDWLGSLLDSVRDNGSSQTEEEQIYEQKANLQEQKLLALDALDLDTAKKIDAQIAYMDAQIDSAEGNASDKLKELTQKKAELEKRLAEKLSDSSDNSDESDDTSEDVNDTDADKAEDGNDTDADKAEDVNDTDADKAEDGDDTDADKADASVTALQAQISRMEVEIAECRMDIPADSQAANIVKSKNEIINLLAEGDDSGDADANHAVSLIESNIDVLIDSLEEGSALAQEALKDVYQKLLAKSELEGVGAYKSVQDKIESAISDSVVNSSLSGEMTPAFAQDVMAEALGVERLTDEQGNILPDISQEDLSAVLIALGEFDRKTGRVQNEAAQEEDSLDKDSSDKDSMANNKITPMQAFVEGISSAIIQDEDCGVFLTKRQGTVSYVPVQTLAKYMGYRYIWNDTRKNAVLSRGRCFYSFKAFHDRVENENGEIIYMDSAAVFSGGIYIPKSFAEDYFGCDVCDISGTNYSVLVNDKVVEKSQELLSELLEKGGF